MRVQVFKTLDRVRSSFWFLPAVMAAGAVMLAFVTVAVDKPLTEWMTTNWDVIFTGGAEGAGALLGAIAGSMITIAGVVFSMTLVALSLASSQLGPRLLGNFMRDRPTQTVLGTFIATFLYCLLVLRTIRRAEEVAFVPHLSVTIGVLLAVASVAVLIYFIHHVSISIQVNEIVARVGAELIEAIELLFPEKIGQGAQEVSADPPDAGFLDAIAREGGAVGSSEDGYLQFVDGDALMELAKQEEVVVRIERRPGQYIVATSPLALVWPPDRITDRLGEQVNSAFALGNQRTPGQDVEFMVNQLVEIAVRALSPAVNDPFTAVTCVDALGSALCRLAQRDIPSPWRYDPVGRVRVISPPVTFPDMADAAFNQIRQYGVTSAAVTIRMLETLAVVAEFVIRPVDRAALLRHANMISRASRERLTEEEDRRVVESRFQIARRALSDSPGADP